MQAPPLGERIQASREKLDIGRFDLGVLLVHGIGQQTRGDTLTEAGDQILRWLRLRVEEPPESGNLTVLDVTARAPSGDAIPAAHAVVRIAPPEGAGRPSNWVVAEAWWAEVFRPATYNEMAGWVVTVGPWVFATQVAAVRRRLEIGVDVPTPLRVLLIPVTLVFGLVMAAAAAIIGFFVTALAAAVFVVAITRIPFLAGAAQRLQRQMANEFGDAYVLTRSPIRFGAMASAVRADLQALREQCNSVVLVAHSQGTAVAWFALIRELTDGRETPEVGPKRAPVGLFLTYGQAVRKLTFALTMAREQTAFRTFLALSTAGLVGAAIAGYLVTDLWWVPAILGILAVVAELFLLQSATDVWDKAGEEIGKDWKRVLKQAPDIEWLDLWASADPASVGPLDVDGRRISSYKIRNLGSILGDHTTYWHNTTEFLAIVAGKLFGLGGPQIYAVPLTDQNLRVAAMRRHARVVFLTTIRFIVLGAIIAGLVWVLLTPSLGAELIAWIDGLDLPFVDSFFANPPEWAVRLAGFVPVLIAGFIVWRVLEGIWKRLVEADETIYFHAKRRPLWSAGWVVLGALTGIVAIGAAILLNASYGPDLAVGYLVGTLLLALLGLSVLSSGGLTFAGTEKAEPTRVALGQMTSRTDIAAAVAFLAAIIVIALPLGAAMFASAEVAAVILAIEAIVISVVLALEGTREYRVFHGKFVERNRPAAVEASPAPEPPTNPESPSPH